jgi:hypothetical protein
MSLQSAAGSTPKEIPLDNPDTLFFPLDFKVHDKKIYLFDPRAAAATVKRYSLKGEFEKGLLPGGYGFDTLYTAVQSPSEGGGDMFWVDADGILVPDPLRGVILSGDPDGISWRDLPLLLGRDFSTPGVIRRDGRVMAYSGSVYLVPEDGRLKAILNPPGEGRVRNVAGGSEGKPYWLLTGNSFCKYSYFGLLELTLNIKELLGEEFLVLDIASSPVDGLFILAVRPPDIPGDPQQHVLVELDRAGEVIRKSDCPPFKLLAEADGLLYAMEYGPGEVSIQLFGPSGKSSELFTLDLGGKLGGRRIPLDLELDGESPLVLSADLDSGAVVTRISSGERRDLFSIEDLPGHPWFPGFSLLDGEIHLSCGDITEGSSGGFRQEWVRRYSLDGALLATLSDSLVSNRVTGLCRAPDGTLALFLGRRGEGAADWIALVDMEYSKADRISMPPEAKAEDYLVNHRNFAEQFGDRLLVSCPRSDTEDMAVRLVDIESGKSKALRKLAALDVRVLATEGGSIYVLWLDDLIFEVDEDQRFVSIFEGFRDIGLALHARDRILSAEVDPEGDLYLLDSARDILIEVPGEDFASIPEYGSDEVEGSMLELEAGIEAYRSARGEFPDRLSPEIIELSDYVSNRTSLLRPFTGNRILSYRRIGEDELNYELFVLAGDRDQEIWKIDKHGHMLY